jgi:hypothetical protein
MGQTTRTTTMTTTITRMLTATRSYYLAYVAYLLAVAHSSVLYEPTSYGGA